MCGALTLHTGAPGGGPVALEIVADGNASRFCPWTRSPSRNSASSADRLGRPIPRRRSVRWSVMLPTGDPVRVGPHEQIACYTMVLRVGDHLPIRTFQDRDLDSDAGAAQADPVLGVLGALDDLPPGWRALSQVVLFEPAPANWARAYQRLALQNPVSAERSARSDSGTSLASVISIFGLGLAAVVGLNAWSAWQRGDWSGVRADHR